MDVPCWTVIACNTHRTPGRPRDQVHVGKNSTSNAHCKFTLFIKIDSNQSIKRATMTTNNDDVHMSPVDLYEKVHASQDFKVRLFS